MWRDTGSPSFCVRFFVSGCVRILDHSYVRV
ncbi:hypothetical protein M6B38_112755 [Iris pallida]|uniref:Uncharacterized protein n=1 Tax=Iris pallida TaxID=29817 RepID=A0AAX6DMX9_IRIPA|nr:hypothetical protein M6B38_112755 [Iris pallida]